MMGTASTLLKKIAPPLTAAVILLATAAGAMAQGSGDATSGRTVGPSSGNSPVTMMKQWLKQTPGNKCDVSSQFPNGMINYGEHGETAEDVDGPQLPGKIWPITLPPSRVHGPEKMMAWAKEMNEVTGYSRPEIGTANLTPAMCALALATSGQMLADQLQSPQASMPRAREEQNQQVQQQADNCAAMERAQSGCALDFCSSYLKNFTVDDNNKWNKIRNQLFVPMAILLLLPGAVLAQTKATVSQGFAVLGDISPFDGIYRSLVGIFLIPGTYLVVNYGIDLSNSITYTISSEYQRIFGTDMYQDAMAAHIRAFPFRQPAEDKNYVPEQEAKMGPLSGGNTPFAKFEGKMLDVKLMDPVAKLNIVPKDRANEQTTYGTNAQRQAYNGANAALAMSWNILCAFQMAYLYYLWFVGPVVAALWVYPSKQLRDAFPSWCEGVLTICFWSLFWNTTILLMACFRGVDDTGTVIMTALNFLSTACVKFAFDFAGLVKDAGRAAAKEMEKAAGGGGRPPGPGPNPCPGPEPAPGVNPNGPNTPQVGPPAPSFDPGTSQVSHNATGGSTFSNASFHVPGTEAPPLSTTAAFNSSHHHGHGGAIAGAIAGGIGLIGLAAGAYAAAHSGGTPPPGTGLAGAGGANGATGGSGDGTVTDSTVDLDLMDLGDDIDASLNVDDIDHNYVGGGGVNPSVKVDGSTPPPTSEPPAQSLTPAQALAQFFGTDGAPPVAPNTANLPGTGPVSLPGVNTPNVNVPGVTPPNVQVASVQGAGLIPGAVHPAGDVTAGIKPTVGLDPTQAGNVGANTGIGGNANPQAPMAANLFKDQAAQGNGQIPPQAMQGAREELASKQAQDAQQAQDRQQQLMKEAAAQQVAQQQADATQQAQQQLLAQQQQAAQTASQLAQQQATVDQQNATQAAIQQAQQQAQQLAANSPPTTWQPAADYSYGTNAPAASYAGSDWQQAAYQGFVNTDNWGPTANYASGGSDTVVAANYNNYDNSLYTNAPGAVTPAPLPAVDTSAVTSSSLASSVPQVDTHAYAPGASDVASAAAYAAAGAAVTPSLPQTYVDTQAAYNAALQAAQNNLPQPQIQPATAAANTYAQDSRRDITTQPAGALPTGQQRREQMLPQAQVRPGIPGNQQRPQPAPGSGQARPGVPGNPQQQRPGTPAQGGTGNRLASALGRANSSAQRPQGGSGNAQPKDPYVASNDKPRAANPMSIDAGNTLRRYRGARKLTPEELAAEEEAARNSGTWMT